MSLIAQRTSSLAGKLPKAISPTAHGVIDFAHAAFFLTVGLICSRSNKRAASAAFVTGGSLLVQSLLTDYKLGLKPLISFETHGKIDAVFAASSWRIPAIFGFAGTPAARVFQLNSLAESGVVAMTDWNSERAHSSRQLA